MLLSAALEDSVRLYCELLGLLEMGILAEYVYLLIFSVVPTRVASADTFMGIRVKSGPNLSHSTIGF